MKFIIIFHIAIFCEFSSAFFGYTRFSNTHQEPQFRITKCCKRFDPPKEKWMEQKLDNFNPQDERKWQMRYFEDLSKFEPDGPIFIYLGGEWTISAGSISYGTLVYEMATETKGALFYTEHRYYGKSHPTPNTTTSNLKYLSVDQALADVAHFIDFVRSSSAEFQNSKVIVLGGSYSASMAAWMRLKYPHLVTGAIASSGPVHAKIDFYEYKEVMSRSILNVGGEDCHCLIENAFAEMEELVEKRNTSRITKAFNLCQELSIPIDVPHFFYEISDVVAGLVQSHRNYNIQMGCEQMINNSLVMDDLEAFASWVRGDSGLVSKGIKEDPEDQNTTETSDCLNFSYKHSIETFSNVEWGSVATQQMRQWIYQTCSEFAWFQTSTSDDQIFGTTYGVDYFLRICNDLYDNSFKKLLIEHNIKRTNVHFGGFTPQLTNVVFTNGDLDPWHPMSVLEDISESVPAIIIPLSAHVSDLGAISDYDSPEMKAAKQRVMQLVLKWLEIDNIEESD